MEGRISKIQSAVIVMVAVGAVLFTVSAVNGVHSWTSYTCLQCRAQLQKEKWLGIPFSRLEQNACSRWYEQGHPAHEHDWCWIGGETTVFPLGGKMFSCGKQHPIWGMHPETQLEYMQSAQPAQLGAFWRIMRTGERHEQRDLVMKTLERVDDAR